MLVERFLSFMVTADERQRCDAASLLARLHGDPRLGEIDREAVEAGMTILLDDPSVAVRQALARAVVDDNRTPQHLAVTLGHDIAPVAAIIVAGTTQLLEGELVDLVAVGGPEVQKAAAERQTVTSTLAAALSEVGDQDAVVELLLNTGADIPEFSLLRILERLGHEPFVRRAVSVRDDLGIAVRQALARLEAAAVHGVSLAAAAEGATPHAIAAREAAERDTVDLAADASDAEIPLLVAHLQQTGQLTTALILRAAVTGDMRFTGASLAYLTGIDEDRVFGVLERGEETIIRALALKAGLPDRAVPALVAAIEVARDDAAQPQCEASYGHVRRTVERIVARYRDVRDDELDDLVATLRRYAGDAARDAARRYVARALQTPPALFGPDLAGTATSEAELIETSEADLSGFAALGAAFVDADWQPATTDAVEISEADLRPPVAPVRAEPAREAVAAESRRAPDPGLSHAA
jgi:uncharacterized protein (DUF2336 family)